MLILFSGAEMADNEYSEILFSIFPLAAFVIPGETLADLFWHNMIVVSCVLVSFFSYL